ncbi:PGF-CTERM sorting domain-containing protein [Halosimplex amylolyticum]|uniref:PGF-CTERM sorting domain-containing protein n=1 Tax=Halosimplex amylolyticum TaxID=3396616 RepID=UPI003F564B4A
MSRPSGRADGVGEQGLTRRSVLAGSAATLTVGVGALAGASGVAAGQITEAAAIPQPERWDDANLAGFMIHVGSTASIERADTARQCEVVGSDTWPPDELLAYEVQLINRKDDAASEEETTMYIGGRADVAPGKLYIINRFNRCDNGFVGISLEQIGRSDVDVTVDDSANAATTAADDGGSGAFGPGFGLPAAIAALLGGGALLRWRDAEE